jgi:hypothetical protein
MMYSGDEDFDDDVTSGLFEGEFEQADFERGMEDEEDNNGGSIYEREPRG